MVAISLVGKGRLIGTDIMIKLIQGSGELSRLRAGLLIEAGRVESGEGHEHIQGKLRTFARGHLTLELRSSHAAFTVFP